MAGTYEVWLTNDYGVRIAPLDDILQLEASHEPGKIGSFRGVFRTALPIEYIQPDYMVQIWRAPEGGRPFMWRPYFIRKWRLETFGSDTVLTTTGVCPNDLLRRRIIAAFAGAAQSEKTDYADDMAKEVVTESLADGVAPTPDAGTRVWANLSIAADLSLGPTITKGFSFDQLLTLDGGGALPAIAEAAREAGTEVFYDIVVLNVTPVHIDFQFRTYTGQPGNDVSNEVVFDNQRGNLESSFIEYDYTEEVNYVYAAGQGLEAEREIVQVYDSVRYLRSQWSRCEAHADARNETGDGVREAGRVRLYEGSPILRLGGNPIDTEGTRFGRDWKCGDKVTGRFYGVEFVSIVRAVAISYSPENGEVIMARIEHEES